jgi:urease accessory protein
MKRPILLSPPSLALVATLASLSTAHAHHAEAMSGQPFLQGLSMPLHGLDHVLSALAVGLVAAQVGGRLRLWFPLLFSVLLLVGGCLNLSGVSLPELAVPIAAIALGAVIYYGKIRMVLFAGLAVLLAAVVNGQALLEKPVLLSSPLFFLGCGLSGLLVCSVGFLSGAALQLNAKHSVARLTGAAVALGAAILAFVPEWNDCVIRLIEGVR